MKTFSIILVSLVVLVGVSYAINRFTETGGAKTPFYTEILLDNSSSGTDFNHQCLLAKQSIKVWLSDAEVGDSITIWVFNKQPNRELLRKAYHFQLADLTVPAYASRKNVVIQQERIAEDELADIPRVDSSPILEGMGRVWDSRTGCHWQLTVYTDLMQTSNKLTLTSEYMAKNSDTAILSSMATAFGCVDAGTSPKSLHIIWCYGAVDKQTAVSARIHERIRKNFVNFFRLRGVEPEYECTQ